MPEISRFFGIIIRMYFADHNPPHFHAYYQEYGAEYDIKTLEIIQWEATTSCSCYGSRMGVHSSHGTVA